MLLLLLVDDETDTELLFASAFRKWTKNNLLKISYFNSADKVWDYFCSLRRSEQEVAFVISDINMPGMNGIELLEKVKDKNPNVEVMLMTAYDTDNHRKQSQLSGASKFYAKPVDFRKLKQDLIERYPELELAQ